MQRSSEAGKNRGKRRKSAPSHHLPIRWTELPHQELYQRALNAMALGSRDRASEDSVKHVLKRRLPKLDPSDHFRYIEIECRRVVETLRTTRDQYRAYLEEQGCKPIAEMYWVVFRFAVIPYAVKLVRAAASDYVINTQVDRNDWHTLYGYSWKGIIPLGEKSSIDNLFETVQETMVSLIHEETFREVMTGGPFGRDGQMRVGRMRPAAEFQIGEMTLLDTIKMRQELWEKCYPWTEGLARLFDAGQEELFCQAGKLTEDGRGAESNFVSLSEFEKIAHKHLVDMRRRSVNSRNLSRDAWLGLLRELDERELVLDRELKGKAKRVLDAVRKNGHKVKTWEHCYDAKLRTSLDDGKIYDLKRQVTHAIHNAAKRAAYQLGKIWNPK